MFMWCFPTIIHYILFCILGWILETTLLKYPMDQHIRNGCMGDCFAFSEFQTEWFYFEMNGLKSV